ncbi:MAG: hypothetical protein LUI10_06025 [Lachnospiraceae bacterium]|nr:hypothetical protein [Lachnospiraceae bacterium]
MVSLALVLAVLRIRPHYYRTILTYLTALVLMLVFCRVRSVVIGFRLIVLSVMIRMAISREEKGVFEVKLLWRR